MDWIEAKIYSVICSHEGIKAKDIGHLTGEPRSMINHYLYRSHYMKDLCYQDREYRWHGLIRQEVPHRGLADFSGYYGWVNDFLNTDYEDFLAQLKIGCKNIGRNLNDTRGLFHSFEETYDTMQNLFGDLMEHGMKSSDWENWEILFELRIKRSKMIRIYADVILITDQKVFSLEFKMKDEVLKEDVAQAAKYCEYLEVLFGPDYDVIPALVLSNGENVYEEAEIRHSTAMIPVCSGDRLYQLMETYQ